MEALGLLALLQARPGQEAVVEEFLKSAESLVQQEEGTIRWYAFKIGPSTFGIFDTFADEKGRAAHLSGEIAKTLLASAEELLAIRPQIEMLQILASKPSGA
ncbi:MAG: antibiotic biosynthesis monooxygenase [Silvibacterium sp.]